MHYWNEDRILLLAYEIWLFEGRPEGRADEHWDRAIKLKADED
jgi:hypothetical protein